MAKVTIDGNKYDFPSVSDSVVKKIEKKHSKSSYNFLNRIFGKKDRIQIPFETVKNDFTQNSDYLSVSEHLESLGYSVLDYIEGTCKKQDDDRIFKIGRILARDTKNSHISELFQNGETRANGKKEEDELVITISRNKFDVGFMSTGRGWSSCMSIGEGCNSSFVFKDIAHGTCIAYLHNKSDEGIVSPVCRILLKKFRVGDSRKHKDMFLFMESRAYGSAPSGFTESVQTWINNNFALDEDCELKIESELYNDGIGTVKAFVSKNSPKLTGNASDRAWVARYGSSHHRDALMDAGEKSASVLKAIIDFGADTSKKAAYRALIALNDDSYLSGRISVVIANMTTEKSARDLILSKFKPPSESPDKSVIRSIIHNIHGSKPLINSLLREDGKYIPHYVIWHGNDDIIRRMYSTTTSDYVRLEVIRRVPHQVEKEVALDYIKSATYASAFAILLHDRYDRIDDGRIDEKKIDDYLYEKYPSLKKLIEYVSDDGNNVEFSLENHMFEYQDTGSQWTEDMYYNHFGLTK